MTAKPPYQLRQESSPMVKKWLEDSLRQCEAYRMSISVAELAAEFAADQIVDSEGTSLDRHDIDSISTIIDNLTTKLNDPRLRESNRPRLMLILDLYCIARWLYCRRCTLGAQRFETLASSL